MSEQRKTTLRSVVVVAKPKERSERKSAGHDSYVEEEDDTENDTKALEAWMESIDILKYLDVHDLPGAFSDGVFFLSLIEELFENEIPNLAELKEEILVSENLEEKFRNWNLIDEHILKKLKIERSSWFRTYLVYEKVGYIEDLLKSVKEIAPVRPKRHSSSSDSMDKPVHRDFSVVQVKRTYAFSKEERVPTYLHPLQQGRRNWKRSWGWDRRQNEGR